MLGYPKSDEGEKESVDAATVTQAGAGEALEMQQEADETMATQQGARRAAKTRIRARIVHVGSEYRKDVTSGTCELCIAEWAVAVRDITFEFAATDGSATWETVTPTLHVGPWNDIWEVRVNPFALSKALRHVTLSVDAGRLADAHNEAPTSCRRGRGTGLARPGLRDADRVPPGRKYPRGRYSQATPSLSRSRRGL